MRVPVVIIKDGILWQDANTFSRAKNYLKQVAGTIQILQVFSVEWHLNKQVNMSFLNPFYVIITVSQLLFVIRKRLFRNCFIYNKLNNTIKRPYLDVEGLIYAR